MIDMLSHILKKKFEKGPAKIEIHLGKDDDKKATDLAPVVMDKNDPDDEPQPENGEMKLLQSLTHGDPQDPMPMSRKPTFEEQAKGKMKERMASITKKKTGV